MVTGVEKGMTWFRFIQKYKKFARFLCKLGKHPYWHINVRTKDGLVDYGFTCMTCGLTHWDDKWITTIEEEEEQKKKGRELKKNE